MPGSRGMVSAASVVAAVLGAVTGCNPGAAERDWEGQIEQLQGQVASLSEKVSEQQARLAEREGRIANLMRLGPNRLKRLLRVERIELAGLTGGYDRDGQPGDDGIRVMVRPIDQDGDLLKSAGDITIDLYDLANPSGNEKIGTYRFPAEQARKSWHWRFATGYYALLCPWQAGPPAHTDITVRVEFVEVLTGKSFHQQMVCKIKPVPPASRPSTATGK